MSNGRIDIPLQTTTTSIYPTSWRNAPSYDGGLLICGTGSVFCVPHSEVREYLAQMAFGDAVVTESRLTSFSVGLKTQLVSHLSEVSTAVTGLCLKARRVCEAIVLAYADRLADGDARRELLEATGLAENGGTA